MRVYEIIMIISEKSHSYTNVQKPPERKPGRGKYVLHASLIELLCASISSGH